MGDEEVYRLLPDFLQEPVYNAIGDFFVVRKPIAAPGAHRHVD
jgi:hypothetical protein